MTWDGVIWSSTQTRMAFAWGPHLALGRFGDGDVTTSGTAIHARAGLSTLVVTYSYELPVAVVCPFDQRRFWDGWRGRWRVVALAQVGLREQLRALSRAMSLAWLERPWARWRRLGRGLSAAVRWKPPRRTEAPFSARASRRRIHRRRKP